MDEHYTSFTIEMYSDDIGERSAWYPIRMTEEFNVALKEYEELKTTYPQNPIRMSYEVRTRKVLFQEGRE